MQILLIDESVQEAAATKRCFDGAGHELESLVAGPAATARALDGGFDIVVADWTLARPYTRELVRAIRAKATKTHTYIIVSTQRCGSTDAAAIFASGADDLIRRPFVREEMLGRVACARRLKPLLDSNAASSFTSNTDAVAAWAEVEQLTMSTLGDMTTMPFLLGDVASPFVPSQAASVRLSRAADQREFQLILEVDTSGLEILGNKMFESTEAALLSDLLLEMTNTTAGAFMRRALEEGTEMTMNLPVVVAPSQLDAERKRAEIVKERRLVSQDGAVTVHLSVALRARGNVFVPATRLAEGMVLARDLLTDTGALLLKAGTRITASASSRVRSLVTADRMVEIADCSA